MICALCGLPVPLGIRVCRECTDAAAESCTLRERVRELEAERDLFKKQKRERAQLALKLSYDMKAERSRREKAEETLEWVGAVNKELMASTERLAKEIVSLREVQSCSECVNIRCYRHDPEPGPPVEVKLVCMACCKTKHEDCSGWCYCFCQTKDPKP